MVGEEFLREGVFESVQKNQLVRNYGVLWVSVFIFYFRKRGTLTKKRSPTQVISGEILIGQIRLVPAIGQWKEKADLKVLQKGEKEEKKRGRRRREKTEEEIWKVEQTHVAWRSHSA